MAYSTLRDMYAPDRLKLENAVLKESLRESEERYAYLLGRYQEDVGNKIIHF